MAEPSHFHLSQKQCNLTANPVQYQYDAGHVSGAPVEMTSIGLVPHPVTPSEGSAPA